MSVTIPRPRKFKGPNRQYIKVNLGGGTKNVVLDDEVLNDWDNITTVTVDMVDYTQRTATEADVESGAAENVGDLIEDSWSRPEVIDYSTMTREVALKQHTVSIDRIERQMLSEVKLSDARVQAIAAEID